MSNVSAPAPDDQRRELVELYDSALPEVYGYLASRCGSAAGLEAVRPSPQTTTPAG